MSDEKKTVRELADSVVNEQVTFADFDARGASPFAVEGNDTSGYKGVSPEYRTYASEVDAPASQDDEESEEDEPAEESSDDESKPDSGSSSFSSF